MNTTINKPYKTGQKRLCNHGFSAVGFLLPKDFLRQWNCHEKPFPIVDYMIQDNQILITLPLNNSTTQPSTSPLLTEEQINGNLPADQKEYNRLAAQEYEAEILKNDDTHPNNLFDNINSLRIQVDALRQSLTEEISAINNQIRKLQQ